MIVDKISIRPNCVNLIKIPKNSRLIHFGRIKFDLYLWFIIEGGEEVKRRFLLLKDREELPKKIKAHYVSSAIRGNQSHHLFELEEENECE